MIETKEILPGITLRCCRDTRFKQGCMSFQFVRQMDAKEAHLNALLPSVMLRATVSHPDLRSISQHLDSLYGVTLGALVRRIGDYQTVGFYLNFMDDRFALPGESVLDGVLAFLEEVLTQSPLKDGGFLEDLLESEKKNLIATIESELNNKAAYAQSKLLKAMCREDAFGLPRLGEKEDVAQIGAKELYDHYLRVRKESPLEIFYVGGADMETVTGLVAPMVEKWERSYVNLPDQTPFKAVEGQHLTESMEVAQGKLSMGFVTPILRNSPDFAALHLLNTIFGAGMTSKLFQNVRERLSLCYSIGSAIYVTKGILTVNAGIDFEKEQQTRQEILHQLELCKQGQITQEELRSAKEAIYSGLRSAMDSPGAIEGYHSTAALNGTVLSREEYMEAVEKLTIADVAAAANTVTYHSSYFLKGVEA